MRAIPATTSQPRQPRRALAIALAAALATLTAAGCGDDDKRADREAAPSSAQRPDTTSRQGSTSAPASSQSSGSGSTASSSGSAAGSDGAARSSPSGSSAPGSTQSSSSTPGNGGSTMGGNTASSPSPGAAAGANSSSTAGSTNGAAGNLMAGAGSSSSSNIDKAVKPDAQAAIGTTERRFIATAASAGMMEVAAGKLAQERGQSAAVKQFGVMLERDHNQANQELVQLAASKGVPVPSEMMKEHQAKLDKLRKVQGREFDRMFIEQVGRTDHKKDIADFERAARESNDADVRGFAAKSLPVLKRHHEQAMQLAQAGGKDASRAGSSAK